MAFLESHAAAKDTCYSESELSEISRGLDELELCRETLKLRESFIEEQRLGTPVPEAAWWQEPSVVVAGVVVSFSVGLAIGLLATR